MGLAEPIWLSRGAWQAIRDEAIAPAAAQPDIARLAVAWDQARPEGDRVAVFLDAPLAVVLAQLLDARPELALG